jgi:hypothetical protein
MLELTACVQGDIGLAAYNRLLRTVSEFHTQAYDDPMSRTGLNKVSLDMLIASFPHNHSLEP